jgi:hypothetical protein
MFVVIATLALLALGTAPLPERRTMGIVINDNDL